MQLTDPIRVLIIDDDEDDFIITEQMIRDIPNGNFVIDWCPRHAEALDKICSKSYDIYFIDYFLGGITGMDLLKRSMACNTDSPMILLTGKGNRSISLEALSTGAYDYLVKSELNAEKLERCIRYSLDKSATLKQLRDNENKYRSVFEKTRDAIFLSDLDLNLSDANTAMEKMFGYQLDELRSMSVYDLLADEGNINVIHRQLEQKREISDFETGFYDRSGEELACIFSALVISKPDGTEYIQGFLHDISRLKKAEKSALMAEKLAAVGRLARTLAHEIRNPLTNINLALDHLSEMKGFVAQRHFLDIIRRNSIRINDSLTELLASAKPAHAEMKRFVLQEILDASINDAMDRIILKRIKMQLRYVNDPVVILADPDKLRIAFLNMIINAIEAMQEDKGRLMVVLEDGGNYWKVKITDNGGGIPEEDIPKLFEPYFTAKRNGLGLGLPATLNILQAHGAAVEVNSVADVGTTFSIRFPKVSTSPSE